MSSKYQSKREQFTKKEKSKVPFMIVGVSGVLLIAVVAIFLVLNKEEEGEKFGDVVASPRSYMGKVVSMTPIEPVVEEGKVKIPLEVIDQYNNVFFELKNDEDFLVPLMAYITPSGRLFVGSSMCEPCRGRTFSLAGEALVCDTCRTTYNIEDHSFISGSPACGSYPPVDMKPYIEDGTVIFNLEEVLKWRIRS